MVETREYVIMLPQEAIKDDTYAGLSKRGGSRSSSPQEAVSQYVYRQAPTQARRILGVLKGLKSLASYAIEVPEISAEDGGSLNEDQVRLATEVFLAQELADRAGNARSAASYLPQAMGLLDSARSDRERSAAA